MSPNERLPFLKDRNFLTLDGVTGRTKNKLCIQTALPLLGTNKQANTVTLCPCLHLQTDLKPKLYELWSDCDNIA